ncbi:MAG: hypothetical protein IJT14_03900 [Rickettsiales bacterium]|nr:hypothetical protein [Rickettsiales bacterium]
MNKINVKQQKFPLEKILNDAFFDQILARLKNEALGLQQGIQQLGGINEQNYQQMGRAILDTLIYETITELNIAPNNNIKSLRNAIRKEIFEKAVAEDNIQENLKIDDERIKIRCKEVQKQINDFMWYLFENAKKYNHKKANNNVSHKNNKGSKKSSPDIK